MTRGEKTLGYLIVGVVLTYAGLKNIGDQIGQMALLIGIVFLLVGIKRLI
mgnify:CR=1 FL=1